MVSTQSTRSGPGAAGAVEHARQHVEPRVVAGRGVARLETLVVVDGAERGEGQVGPAGPVDDLPAVVPEGAQIGVRGVEDGRRLGDVLLPGRETVLRVVPVGIVEDEVLEQLGPEAVLRVGNPGGPPLRGADHPRIPAAAVVLAAVVEAVVDRLAVRRGAIVDGVDGRELRFGHATVGRGGRPRSAAGPPARSRTGGDRRARRPRRRRPRRTRRGCSTRAVRGWPG